MKTFRPLTLTSRRSFLGTLVLGVLAALGGCDTTGAFLNPDAPKYGEPAYQVMAWWEPAMRFTPDPTHNGELMPGLAGRVYLVGPPEIKEPVVGDGALTIELFDDAQPPGPNGPVAVYRWSFDAATLQRLLRHDAIGWGYTMFLPCL